MDRVESGEVSCERLELHWRSKCHLPHRRTPSDRSRSAPQLVALAGNDRDQELGKKIQARCHCSAEQLSIVGGMIVIVASDWPRGADRLRPWTNAAGRQPDPWLRPRSHSKLSVAPKPPVNASVRNNADDLEMKAA